jgi:hypothetical protein
MSNRFKCLKPNNDDSDKPDDNKYRVNRFNKPKHVNSRWQRSNSPEKRNTFSNPRNNKGPPRNDRGFSKDKKQRFDKGGFGKYRYNRGRKGPSVFDNVKKDSFGRPMLAGATTSGFDIGLALQKQKPKQKKEKKKNREIKEDPKLVPFKKEKDEKNEEELKAEAEWNKQMILNMQYEWETESEEEEDEHDPLTPNTDLV